MLTIPLCALLGRPRGHSYARQKIVASVGPYTFATRAFGAHAAHAAARIGVEGLAAEERRSQPGQVDLGEVGAKVREDRRDEERGGDLLVFEQPVDLHVLDAVRGHRHDGRAQRERHAVRHQREVEREVEHLEEAVRRAQRVPERGERVEEGAERAVADGYALGHPRAPRREQDVGEVLVARRARGQELGAGREVVRGQEAHVAAAAEAGMGAVAPAREHRPHAGLREDARVAIRGLTGFSGTMALPANHVPKTEA